MKVACRKCGHAFEVELVGTKSIYICPECGTSVSVIEEMAGKKTTVIEKKSKEEGVLAPGERFAGYVIKELIGSGGMGDIYKAKHISMDRTVALKILKPSLSRDKAFIRRFIREARSAGRLNHPNIIQIYDVGRENNIYYFSMEYVEGESLDEVIARRGVFTVREALAVVIEVARALQKAHERGIVHRDIKPANIMLSKQGVIKVADFGLARPLDTDEPSLTQTGVALGTPFYMAPEQIRGAHDVDIRADIYGLGCTFYHLLTGRVPFRGRSTFDVLKGHESRPVQFPPGSTIPKEVRHVILKMMAKKPEERFENPEALLHALENLGNTLDEGGATVATKKAFAPAGVSRRRPFPAAVAAGCVLLLLAAAGVFFLVRHGDTSSSAATSRPEQGPEGGGTASPPPRGEAWRFSEETMGAFCRVENLPVIARRVLHGSDFSAFLNALSPDMFLREVSRRLNISFDILKKCIFKTESLTLGWYGGTPLGIWRLPSSEVKTLFTLGFPAGSVTTVDDHRLYTGYRGMVVMEGGEEVVSCPSVDMARRLLEEDAAEKISSFARTLQKRYNLSRPVAFGYATGDFLRAHGAEAVVPDAALVEKVIFGFEKRGGEIKGRVRVRYSRISETLAGTARVIPPYFLRESRLPGQGWFYAASYLPDVEEMLKRSGGKDAKPVALEARFLADVVSVLKKEGVDFVAAGVYREGKKRWFTVAEMMVPTPGKVVAALKRGGYRAEIFPPKPGGEPGGRRRSVSTFLKLSNDTGFHLFFLCFPGRMYVTDEKEGIHRVFRSLFFRRRGFSKGIPPFRWPRLEGAPVLFLCSGEGTWNVAARASGDSLVLDVTIRGGEEVR